MASTRLVGSCGTPLWQFARYAAVVACLALGALAGTVQAIPVTNLKLWLRADDLAGPNGTKIPLWSDASGNANDAVAYTPLSATNQPTLQNSLYNGHNGVRFTTTTALRNSTIASMGDMTIFAVYNWNTVSNDNYYLSFGTFDPEFGIGNVTAQYSVFDAAYQNYNLLPLQTTNHLYRTTYVRTAVNQHTVTLENGSTQTKTFAFAATPTTYQLGSQQNNAINGNANFDLAELIVYSGVLSAADLAAVNLYLEARFDPNFVGPVPEPSTFALLGLGAVGLAIRVRRRRRSAS